MYLMLIGFPVNKRKILTDGGIYKNTNIHRQGITYMDRDIQVILSKVLQCSSRRNSEQMVALDERS